MRILLSTDTVGGVWQFTATLAGRLVAEGHRVLLAVIGWPSEQQLAQLPEELPIECRSYRLEWMAGAGEDIPPAGKWLARLCRAWQGEVVHLNQMAYGAAGFSAPTVMVVHSDVASWFGEVLGIGPPPEWSDYLRSVRAGLAAADRVVAPSAYQAALVERHLGRRVDRVVHNGAAVPPALPPRNGPDLVLCAGRAWDAAKGHDVLDRALLSLGEEGPTAHLLGPLEGGDGPPFRASRLVCHGPVGQAEVWEWMRRATIFVGPSLYEPFGLAPLEAALRGCALLLSDIGSFRELWDDCAEFFPPGDADALAARLLELLQDPRACERLAMAARERAASAYTAERLAADYLGLYAELTTAAGSTPRAETPARRSAPPPSARLGR